jgi:hypothetical protein
VAEHGPSEKAEDRGTLAVYELQHGRPPADTANGAWLYGESRSKARTVLAAAHDPALGLDRSVCLRDVVAFLERKGQFITGSVYGAAGEVERAFTESSSPDREGAE